MMMGHDGGICWECKVACSPGGKGWKEVGKAEQNGKDGGWDEWRRKATLLRVFDGGGVYPCLTACCLPENEQTSDYDINANLNVSQ